MKKTSLFSAIILAVALSFGATGCKHKPVGITTIPGMNPKVGGTVGPETPAGKLPDDPTAVVDGSRPFDPTGLYSTLKNGPHTEDRDTLAPFTVYFDTDSATIKKSEQEKLQHVADHLKGNATVALEIEGHCDERGTEGYNIALGNKRALAVREYLANLGVDAGHIGVVSYGEAKPAEKGNSEAAWKKNRRGVFVLLVPKQ